MSWMSGLERASRRGTVLLASIGLTLAIALPASAPAAAPGGGGETITCEPGQTANTDLGTCQDPVCGPGTERDPSGNTRYCVAIPCTPPMHLDPDTNQCLSTPPPPPPKCPDGSPGKLIHLPTGVTVIQCPKQLPPPPRHTPPVTTQTPNAGVRY